MKSLILDLKDVSVQRQGKNLLSGISFHLNTMEVLSVIGPKGAGKGLLLKTMLGIQNGRVSGEIIRPQKMGLVSSVYPSILHFSVFENLSLVAKLAGVRSHTHLAEEIEEVLKTVNLWTELKFALHEKVEALTDYQRSCLDLARTLLLKPEVILLDKPTMTFDPEKKTQYEAIIEKLKNNLQLSFVWLNHDLEQAARVSDKILYIRDGRMVEFGLAGDVFTMPTHPDTENFISRRIHV